MSRENWKLVIAIISIVIAAFTCLASYLAIYQRPIWTFIFTGEMPEKVVYVTVIPSTPPTILQPSHTPKPISPTPTPIPTATPTDVPPDTSPGSVLGTAEVWRQNGVTLRVNNTYYYVHWTDSQYDWDETPRNAAFVVWLILENRTGQDLLLDFDTSSFSIRDDVGDSYTLCRLSIGSSEKDTQRAEKVSQVFPSGQQLFLGVFGGENVSIDTRARQMIVQIKNLSRIANAKWAFDIQR
jgi:hypothetical protein